MIEGLTKVVSTADGSEPLYDLYSDKKTGKLAGEDNVHIGPRIFHGQWSSPSAGRRGTRWPDGAATGLLDAAGRAATDRASEPALGEDAATAKGRPSADPPDSAR